MVPISIMADAMVTNVIWGAINAEIIITTTHANPYSEYRSINR